MPACEAGILVSKSLSKRNIAYSVFAQVVSLSVSFLMGLIVPKAIPELQYAYWQAYILYINYTGVFHFGILDGFALRFSQYDYSELDKQRARSHFLCVLGIESSLAACLALISCTSVDAIAYRHVFIFVAVGLITKNIFAYSSFLLQITNQISRYSRLVIAHRLVYGIFVVLFLCIRVDCFEVFCLADLVSDLFAIIYCICICKAAFIGRTSPLPVARQDIKESFYSGVKLMIANFTSMQIISSAKMLIQWHWGDLVFGQLAFSFSLASIFLTFVSAISVVLFPALKRMNDNEYSGFYAEMRRISSGFLFGALLLYFPGYFILEKWLPAYSSSLSSWGILLPYIVFSARVNLLTNNYLKAYRKEKLMLKINISFSIGAFLLYVFCSYVLDDVLFVLISVVFSIVMISIVSELIVGRLIGVSLMKNIFIDILLALAFLISANLMNKLYGFISYGLAFIVYLWFDLRTNRKGPISKLLL